MNEYPRRKANPIVQLIRWLIHWLWFLFWLVVQLIRWLWFLFLLVAIVLGAVVLYWMLEWWNVPIVIAFALAVLVLFRNRARRATR